GRDIFDTIQFDDEEFECLASAFRHCLLIEGQLTFSSMAKDRWFDYQQRNRQKMDDADPLAEDLISRLASAPAQTLAVAMIFEAAMFAKRRGDWCGILSNEALCGAIDHVDECLSAAARLDEISRRFSVAEDAEVIFERVMCDFAASRKGDTIYASRSDLT